MRWSTPSRSCGRFGLSSASAGLSATPPACIDARPVESHPHRAVYDLKLAQSPGASATSKRRCAAASSTISPAVPARAMSCNFARCPNWIPARARSRSAICAPPPGRTATPRSFRFSSRKLDRTTSCVDQVNGEADAQGRRRRRQADQAGATRASICRWTRCSRPSTCAASSRPRGLARGCCELQVYDGSETGEKIYNTLTVIGKRDRARAKSAEGRRGAGGARRADALAGDDQLFRSREGGAEPASRRRSTRSLSSSTRTAFRARCCSTTAISSSRGEMTSLEVKTPKPCP